MLQCFIQQWISFHGDIDNYLHLSPSQQSLAAIIQDIPIQSPEIGAAERVTIMGVPHSLLQRPHSAQFVECVIPRYDLNEEYR